MEYYKYFVKKEGRGQSFTPDQLDKLRELDKQQLSKYVGVRAFLDKEENDLLGKLASVKNQKFALQSQKGQKLDDIQKYAKDQADVVAKTMFPEDANDVYKAGEQLLMNRSKGQVFSMTEKELITPVFINTMNNLPLLSRQINLALDEGNDAAAAVLTVELNRSMAKVAAFFGDMNATSNALNHYKKINADIKMGRDISAVFANGGC